MQARAGLRRSLIRGGDAERTVGDRAAADGAHPGEAKRACGVRDLQSELVARKGQGWALDPQRRDAKFAVHELTRQTHEQGQTEPSRARPGAGRNATAAARRDSTRALRPCVCPTTSRRAAGTRGASRSSKVALRLPREQAHEERSPEPPRSSRARVRRARSPRAPRPARRHPRDLAGWRWPRSVPACRRRRGLGNRVASMLLTR